MLSLAAGCHTCKTRRIKCDGARPTCQRCSRAGRICLDKVTIQDTSFSILVENQFASGKTKRPRGPRISLTMIQPQIDMEDYVLTYFTRYHLQTTSIPFMENCLGNTVTAFRTAQRKCSMIELAISTMAFGIFARAQCHPKAASQASLQYSQLLRTVQHRIGSSMDERDLDACILAVLIISRYVGIQPLSDIAESASFISMPHWSHHDGIVALLKVWSGQYGHRPASFVIKQSRRAAMRSFLLRVLPLPDWLLDGERFGESGLELDYDRLNVRMITLRHMASVFLNLPDLNPTTEARQLDNDLAQLDIDFQAWATRIPSAYTPRYHTLSGPGILPRKHIYSPAIYTFLQPGHSSVWTRYFAARMLIASSRLQIHTSLLLSNRLSPPRKAQLSNEIPNCDFHQQASTTRLAEIQFLSDSIVSSIPFAVGIVKHEPSNSTSSISGKITLAENVELTPHQANLILWPLMIGSGVIGMSPDKQRWLRSELAEVGRVLGDKVMEKSDWTAEF